MYEFGRNINGSECHCDVERKWETDIDKWFPIVRTTGGCESFFQLELVDVHIYETVMQP